VPPKVAAPTVWLAGDVVGNKLELVVPILLLVDKIFDGEVDIFEAPVGENGVGTVREVVAITVAVMVA
jgi:hypothetical protein